MSILQMLLGAGAISRATLSYTYTTSTANASLAMSSISGYISGKSDITITVNSGVYVYSTSVSNAGLTLTGGSTGDTITLVNNGNIIGMGGQGGGSYANNGIWNTLAAAGFTYQSPQTGGNALSIGFNTTIVNNGYIAGGGGGGQYALGHAAGNVIYGTASGGGGAGGGSGGNIASRLCDDNGQYYAYYTAAAAGGGVGASGSTGQKNNSSTYANPGYYTGGGGGRILPGVGGTGYSGVLGGYNAIVPGGGGGAGGGGSKVQVIDSVNQYAAGVGASAGCAAAIPTYRACDDNGTIFTYNVPGASGGGGGWGATGLGGIAGGKAIALNGYTATRSGSGTTYGSVA